MPNLSEVYLKLLEILQIHDYPHPLIPVHPLYQIMMMIRKLSEHCYPRMIQVPRTWSKRIKGKKEGNRTADCAQFCSFIHFVRGQLFQNLNLIKGKKYFHSKIFQ